MNLVIAQFDHAVNPRTSKDLWNEIQGLSTTCPLFKYSKGLEFMGKSYSTFKDFQGCVGTLITQMVAERILLHSLLKFHQVTEPLVP